MNVLYFGEFCDNSLYKKKENKHLPYFVAQYMYEKALCDEIAKDVEVNLEIISIYLTEYFPKDTFLFNRKSRGETKLGYLNFINIPYLREISYFLSACIKILSWYVRNRDTRNMRIYASCHFAPVSLAIVLMGKILSIKRICTFTDLAIFSFSKDRISKMKFYKRILIKPYVDMVTYLQKSYDAYVLFSEGMNQLVNPKNKPNVIVEGIFNGENLNCKTSNIKMNAIAHAGTLNAEYGIDRILDLFELIDDPSLELWLFGNGDMADEINNRAKVDTRIKYFGFIPREDVFEKLKQAKLLINLRCSNDIYTKYSFPSKMFEYMVSTTPVFTTRLQGIPHSYYQFLYVTDDENLNIIKSQILEILQKDQSELNEFGKCAAKYILDKKNSTYQIMQINKLLKSVNN
ncbi:glycosyltransferase [Labilibaculum manganireducens]|uniref:glycosyltransferase n=1 Tax=Labilibaculum manganireducens TaxID=1940525 RepID=UPI0029F4F83E|nr:glycosyltransferase [Labilibaculum manganireducens]